MSRHRITAPGLAPLRDPEVGADHCLCCPEAYRPPLLLGDPQVCADYCCHTRKARKGCCTYTPHIKGLMTNIHWGRRQKAFQIQSLKFGQNGEVKRLKLTSPYKNTKITTAEQLSTKKPGTYPKKAMRWRSHEMVGGVQYNQIPYQLVGRPTDWKITVSQRSPTGVLVLTPLQAPEPEGLAVQGGASSIWLWKPAGLECRISPRLVETETPRLDGAQIISCTLGPRTKQWLHRSLD